MKICNLLCLAGVRALAAAAVPCLAVRAQPAGASLPPQGKADGKRRRGGRPQCVVLYDGGDGHRRDPLDDQASGNPTVIYSPAVAGAAPRFEYQIPMSAASTPSAACLTVYYKGTRFT